MIKYYHIFIITIFIITIFIILIKLKKTTVLLLIILKQKKVIEVTILWCYYINLGTFANKK